MLTRLSTILALLLLTLPARADHKLVAYVPNWIDLAAFADTIDYAKLTHLNIAFENPAGPDGDLSFHDADRVLIAKAHAHGVKALVSLGGGAASEDKTLRARYDALLSDAKRPAFVAKLADYVARHDFDGLDLDLEGPAIGKTYGPFVADLAAALQPKGKLLTAALSKGYGGPNVPDAALARFDFINIMAYDATGPWNPNKPGPHSSLDFAKDNVAYWLDRGVPKSKAVLGVPFYGQAFGPAARKGGWPYKTIVATFPGSENADQAGDTIYYNGLPTIRAKAKYVVDSDLAGVMIWSLDNDAPGDASLLKALHESLSHAASPSPPGL